VSYESELNQQVPPDIIEQPVVSELAAASGFQPEPEPVIPSPAKETPRKKKKQAVKVEVQETVVADRMSIAEQSKQFNEVPPEPVDANKKIKRIVEALLFAAEQPMSVTQLHAVFPELEAPEKQQIQDAIDSLCYDYRQQAIGLHQVASGYRFQVKTDMSPWVARLFAEKPPKYSRALLETIAIIAYQQPVTRGDIEEIRGVSVSSHMIRTLLEREWVKVLAHKEVPGRPALYGTTKQFLDYFNLQSLDAMPPLEELQALALEGEMDI